MSIVDRIRLFFWARRVNRKGLHFVVDTNFLFEKKNRQKLLRLKNICIPAAVWEEISRMSQDNGINGKAEKIVGQEKIHYFLERMVAKKRWRIIGSRGTGIVKKLASIKIKQLVFTSEGKRILVKERFLILRKHLMRY